MKTSRSVTGVGGEPYLWGETGRQVAKCSVCFNLWRHQGALSAVSSRIVYAPTFSRFAAIAD